MSKYDELKKKSEQLHEAVQASITAKNFNQVMDLLKEQAEINSQLAELEFEELRNKQIETDNKISEVFDEINNSNNNFNSFISQFL